MGCITTFLFLCNVVLIIAADIFLWMYSGSMGLFGLIGVVIFFITYVLSTGMSLSPRDFWTSPEFDVFIKKMTYANTAALMAWSGSLIIATILGNEAATEFIHWVFN